MTANISETAKDVVRRNTEEVQGRGNWPLFNELFADDFFDHTPQPGGTRDKAGVLALYKRLREAFPDFTPEIHWQRVDGDVVTAFKTYHGTHRKFSRHRWHRHRSQLRAVDAMRVVNGKITEHWGVANLYSVLQQFGRDRSTAAGSYAVAASGSQIFILRVSGIRNRLSTKHIAGTAIG